MGASRRRAPARRARALGDRRERPRAARAAARGSRPSRGRRRRRDVASWSRARATAVARRMARARRAVSRRRRRRPAPSRSPPVRGAVLAAARTWSSPCATARSRSPAARCVVDPGAHVHDPYRPVGAAAATHPNAAGRRSRAGRSWCSSGASERSDADWVRRLVNRLVRRDIEARDRARPTRRPGLQLTRPCRAGRGDRSARWRPTSSSRWTTTAAQSVDAWCDGDRSTVVVAFDRDAARSDGARVVADRARAGPAARPHRPARRRSRVRGAGRAAVRRPAADPAADDAALATRTAGARALDRRRRPPSGRAASCSPARSTRPRRERASTASSTTSQRPRTAVTLGAARGRRARPTRGTPRRGARGRRAGARRRATWSPNASRAGLPTASRPRTPTICDPSVAGGLGPALTAAAAEPRGRACGARDRPGRRGRPPRRGRSACGRWWCRRCSPARAPPRSRDRPVPRSIPAAPLVIGWHLGDRRRARSGLRGRRGRGHRWRSSPSGPTRWSWSATRRACPRRCAGTPRVTVVPGPDADAADRRALGRARVDAAAARGRAGRRRAPVRGGELRGRAERDAGGRGCEAVDGFVSPHVLVQSDDRAGGVDQRARTTCSTIRTRRARRTEEALRRADALDSPAAAKTVVGRFVGLGARTAERVDA